MAATPTKLPTALQRAYAEQDELFAASEQMLFGKVDSNTEVFDVHDMAILKAAGYPAGEVENSYGRKALLGRVRRIRELQQRAGKKAEYEAAKAAFDKALAAEREHVGNPDLVRAVGAAIRDYANESPSSPLTKTLIDTHAKLQSLVDARQQAEAKLDVMESARADLRLKGLLPPHVVCQFNNAAVAGDPNAEAILNYYVDQLG